MLPNSDQDPYHSQPPQFSNNQVPFTQQPQNSSLELQPMQALNKDNQQYSSSQFVAQPQNMQIKGSDSTIAQPAFAAQESNNMQFNSMNPDNTVIVVHHRKKDHSNQKHYQQTKEGLGYHPGNTYIYPYYYGDTGCYCCCWCNGHCIPCESLHSCPCCFLCDALPCCNGCNGFHCQCLECLPCCNVFECVKNDQCGVEGGCCQICSQCPCTGGCESCFENCDGACIQALPCCNGCECDCGKLAEVLPCCNECSFEPICGCCGGLCENGGICEFLGGLPCAECCGSCLENIGPCCEVVCEFLGECIENVGPFCEGFCQCLCGILGAFAN